MAISKDHPHWQRMRFKTNKVWMATDEQGHPLVEKGKVLIKYQLNQPHEYWVRPDSVVALDAGGDQAGAAKPAPRKKPKPRGSETTPISENERENAICIYTDGACSGNPGPAGIGVVMRYKGNHKEISRYLGSATNNIAELEAIKAGLKAVKNRKLPVILYTDSSYALGLLTKGWKAKQNTELVAEIRKLAASFPKLRFVKVKGHAGDPDNERADRLAVQAVEQAG